MANEKRKYSTAGGAGQGAAMGAMIGTAITPGVGTAIGAGAGALIGGVAGYFAGGDTEYDEMRQAEIDELRRQQEMGLLGLSDEEWAVMEAQLIDPMRASQRQAQLYGLGAMGGAGANAADVARMSQGQQQMMAEQAAPARTAMAAADLQRAAQQEEYLLALEMEKEAGIQQAKAQALGSLGSMFDATQMYAAYAGQAGEAKAKQEFETGMLEAIGKQAESGGDISNSMMMYQLLYGGNR